MFDYNDDKGKCFARGDNGEKCFVHNAAGNAPRPQMRYAQAYVPFQTFGAVFSPEKALMHGTVFPDLYQPYTGSRLRK